MKKLFTSFLCLLAIIFYSNANAQCGATFTYTNINGAITLYAQNVTPAGSTVSWYSQGVMLGTGDTLSVTLSNTAVVCVSVTNALSGCNSSNNSYCDSVLVNSPSGCNVTVTASQLNDSLYSCTASGNGAVISAHNWAVYDTNNGSILATSTQANPVFVLPANVPVAICDSAVFVGGCGASDCYTVTYNPNPANVCTANFSIYPDSLVTGLYWGFNYCTGSNLTYAWLWGDGTSSTGAYPTHTYATSGTYTICLFITSANSFCSDSLCINFAVAKQNNAAAMHEIRFANPNGINDIKASSNISIMPNPVSNNEFTFNYAVNKINTIQVINTNGQVIYNDYAPKSNQIKLNNAPAGLYILKVLNTSGQSFVSTFVKN